MCGVQRLLKDPSIAASRGQRASCALSEVRSHSGDTRRVAVRNFQLST